MCGFAGFTGPNDPALLTRMGERIAQRGPDQHGRYEQDRISLVHARLSIIDLSEAGRQPMRTTDGRYTIVYNGELYNFKALREEYTREGFAFRTQTDTEVFLASLALHGLQDLERMHGIFAFVIWDAVEKRLFAARDRMGIKPLYLAKRGKEIGFASEIKGLLPWTGPCQENKEARSIYLALGYVPGPRTMFEGISSLAPGHLYQWQNGVEALTPYKKEEAASSVEKAYSHSQAITQLQTLVDDSVRSQLVGDRPVGLFLSGGWDSSVIAESMRRAEPEASIEAFTVRFAHDTDDQKFNQDADLARKTAQALNINHHEVVLSAEDIIERADQIAFALDQPTANHSVYALDKVAALAKTKVSIVLSGDGGDESFGGYPRYAFAERMRWLMWIPVGIRRSFVRLLSVSPWVRAHADALEARSMAGLFASFHAAPSRQLSRWFPGVADAFVSAEEAFAEQGASLDVFKKDMVTAFMAVDRALWLCDDAFPRADRMTMLHGLEARVPLTDDALVAFAASLPAHVHVSHGALKRLWREAFADRVQPEVRTLPKRGWFPPTAKWLRAGLHDWAKAIIEEAIQEHAWMDAAVIRSAFKDHVERKGYYLHELWTVIGYQLWWRAYREDIIV